MANQVGLVRFSDGTELFPVVQGTSGGVSARLYHTADEAYAHRDDLNEHHPEVPTPIPDEEPVEVWEWFGNADRVPSFHSTASRSLMLLTGTTSREAAAADYMQEQLDWGFGSR
jgi:hypothetical protein